MRFLSNLTLQQRIGLLVFLGLAVGLGLFSWLGLQSINDSTQRILEERKTMAVIVASHLDETLTHTLVHLGKYADFGGGMPTEPRFRQSAREVKGILFEAGIATRGVFLLDETGAIILVEPDQPQAVGAVLPVYGEIGPDLHEGLPIISSLADAPATGRLWPSPPSPSSMPSAGPLAPLPQP